MPHISTKLHFLKHPILSISQFCDSRNLARIWLASLLKSLLQATVKVVREAGVSSEGLCKERYASNLLRLWVRFRSSGDVRLSFSSYLDVALGFPPTTYHKNISTWLIASSKHSIWKGNRRGESHYQSDTQSLRSDSFGYKQGRKSMERYFKRTKVPSMGEHWEAITVSKTPSQKNKHCTLKIATEKYRRNSVLCLFLLLWQNTLGEKRQLKWKWIYLAHRAVLLSVTAVQSGQWELEAANQYIHSQDQRTVS